MDQKTILAAHVKQHIPDTTNSSLFVPLSLKCQLIKRNSAVFWAYLLSI